GTNRAFGIELSARRRQFRECAPALARYRIRRWRGWLSPRYSIAVTVSPAAASMGWLLGDAVEGIDGRTRIARRHRRVAPGLVHAQEGDVAGTALLRP